MRRYTLIGLWIWVIAGEGLAQESDGVTGTGFTFLQYPKNARTVALGEAGVGLIGSGQAILYNPAGLAFMEGREAYFTYVDWISSIKYYVAGISANVPRIGTLGLSVENHDTGPIESENTTYQPYLLWRETWATWTKRNLSDGTDIPEISRTRTLTKIPFGAGRRF